MFAETAKPGVNCGRKGQGDKGKKATNKISKTSKSRVVRIRVNCLTLPRSSSLYASNCMTNIALTQTVG